MSDSTEKGPGKKDYDLTVHGIVLSSYGVQTKTEIKGKDAEGNPAMVPNPNLGKAYVTGTYMRVGKDGKDHTTAFQAFDEITGKGKELSSASRLIAVARAAGHEISLEKTDDKKPKIDLGETVLHFKGVFVKGREMPEGGNFQDFRVKFVDTQAEKEAHRAAAAAAKKEPVTGGDER